MAWWASLHLLVELFYAKGCEPFKQASLKQLVFSFRTMVISPADLLAAIPLRIGAFVFTPDLKGLGKLESARNQKACVRFFHSISKQETASYSTADLRRGVLWPHTRVYVRAEDSDWRIGRVLRYDVTDRRISYEVQFPKKDFAWFDEEDLQVRCLTPLPDPAEVLAQGGMETQFYHDRRRDLVNLFTDMKAKCRGMTALLSSNIEFVRHQVEVVRRVLEDPVQRYLLADEVGLGKTIEAGIIIRQCLLDEPEGTVLVVVPDHLVGQWERELDRKFGSNQFGERLAIRSFSGIREFPIGAYELVVVDEAHRVVNPKETNDSEIEDTHGRIRLLASSSRRLLLLSATPALGNAVTLLRLLHLLDPVTYRPEGLESFRSRLPRRQEYGRCIRGLRPDAPSLLLKSRAREAQSLFPEDPVVQHFASQLHQASEERNAERIKQTCVLLRAHIADTYRIDHRLLRNRRVDTEGWEFQKRGPEDKSGQIDLSHVLVEIDEDVRMPRLIDLLEEWRIAAVAHAKEWPEEENHLVKSYKMLWEALGSGADAFLLTLDRHPELTSLFPLSQSLLFQCRQLLNEPAGESDRYRVVLQSLASLRRKIEKDSRRLPKLVVFATNTTVATTLGQRLRGAFGPESVLTGTSRDGDESPDLGNWFQKDSVAWLLVCDQSGEEGQNLHFADAIFHFDVPVSAARMEQRIGRLDRFGRKHSVIRHRVLLPADDEESTWYAWFELLGRAFEIFNRPIADVQFLLETIESRIERALFFRGRDGLRDLTDEIRGGLKEERERLDDQQALDQVTLSDSEALVFFDAVQAAEEDEGRIANNIDEWMLGVCQFRRVPVNRGLQPFRLEWTTRTLVPKYPGMRILGSEISERLTYRRDLAVTKPGIELVRIGSRLGDGIERLINWDDRGTAFGTWRFDPAWQGGPLLTLRLCYLVSAQVRDVEVLQEQQVRSGLQRRANALLPPSFETIYLDATLDEITDPHLTAILERPKSNDDFNLGSRRDALFRVVDCSQFAELCARARELSETRLRDSEVFKKQVSEALSAASLKIQERIKKLERRRDALSRESDKAVAFWDKSIALEERLLEALEKPEVRLDSVGVIVVARVKPNEFEG